MRILILFVLLVIAYMIFKAITGKNTQSRNPDSLSKSPTDSSASSQTDEASSPNESGTSQANSSSHPAPNDDVVSSSVADSNTLSASPVEVTTSDTASADLASAAPSVTPDLSWLNGLDTDDTVADISEMFKILNLRESDAPRLSISSDEYTKLKTGDADAFASSKLDQIAQRLRDMLA